MSFKPPPRGLAAGCVESVDGVVESAVGVTSVLTVVSADGSTEALSEPPAPAPDGHVTAKPAPAPASIAALTPTTAIFLRFMSFSFLAGRDRTDAVSAWFCA